MTSKSQLSATIKMVSLAAALCSFAHAQNLDQFKNSVAEVAVGKGEGRSPEVGTGFIVSVDADKLSILTARHLFYDPREKFASDITVTLYVDKLHPRKATLLTDSAPLDLAVIEISGVSSLVSRQAPNVAIRPASERLGIGETLYVFGGKSQAWQVPTVTISDTEDGDRPNGVRFTGIGIRGGFSGSAIVDGNSRLVAVHLGIVESDATFGHAQLMASAYGALVRLGATMNKLDMGTATSSGATGTHTTPAAGCLKPPSGLVSWWTGDSDERDVAGGNNPSGFSAVSHVPGMVQNGFHFGANGYIEIPPASNLANQRFTWAAWVRPDGPGPKNDRNGSVILNQVTNGRNFIQLSWSAASQKFCFIFGANDREFLLSSDTFAPGTFYLVAGTYDGRTFKLFVNGALEGSLDEPKMVTYSQAGWLFGGNKLVGEYSRRWNGIIDEVQAFNRALSDSEIEAIFRAGSAGECKPAQRAY